MASGNDHSLTALHGFLGQPNDWRDVFSSAGDRLQVLAYDIAADVRALRLGEAPSSRATLGAFSEWALRFNETIRARFAVNPAASKPVLLGYSMGGRLAMHAALQASQLYRGLVLVSCHAGLERLEERTARCGRDAEWASRFKSDDWSQLMHDWNHQPVLATSDALDRRNDDFSRDDLAWQLENFSLGRQANLAPELKRLALPVLIITGGRDTQYSLQARRLMPGLDLDQPARLKLCAIDTAPSTSHAGSREHCEIANAGHRVPWDEPREFVERLQSWLANLE
jgi:2-succinyl-6-hydroxy-2,4-cyclohexadiene-1-carboxylate synthase